jgi:hypothetical protein
MSVRRMIAMIFWSMVRDGNFMVAVAVGVR